MSRKNQETTGHRFRFHDYEADFSAQHLRKSGTRVPLEHKPFRVLELLLRNHGNLVTRKDLVSHLWPDSYVNFEHGLNSAVNSLRLALGDSSKGCRFIETRPGIGYCFVAPVEEIADRSKNIEAYQDCLKGYYLLDRMSEEEIYKAFGYFHSAATDESCFALAHAGIADAHSQLALIGSVRPSKVATQASASVDLALQSDPDLSRAHLASARVKLLFHWDCVAAQTALSRALELDPNSVAALTFHASLLCVLGDHQPAIETASHALTLDPLSLAANLHLAACLYANRNFQPAADHCWKILSLWPSLPLAQLLLANSYMQLDMNEEAIVEFQNAQTCPACSAAATVGLTQVFARSGLDSESEQALAELTTQSATRYVSKYWQAAAHAAQKHHAQAASLLQESFADRDPLLLWLPGDLTPPLLHDHKSDLFSHQGHGSKAKP
jgi:DNA-binding winged helix-turn-helix (wHTH) protein